MKFTLSWLKDHLDTNASLDDISKTLTAIGLEVESITDASESLKAFTVAKILEASRHPEADKLQVCKVQSDVGELQIVCGAPNARAGLFVALAKEGAFIPGSNFTIKKTKIRNVESNGMLCSFEELGIAGDSSGIIELPESPIGSSAASALGLDDPLIDIAITPNRPDCLGVRGIARDLAAAGLGTLKNCHPALVAGSPSTNQKTPQQVRGDITVSIETHHCQQFIGCHITGVKNGESPDWLKKRITAIGQKSISALVDITNYFTIDLGRPLHVYDAKKLNGNIIVRLPKENAEEIKTLEGRVRKLSTISAIISDDEKPIAIGGIIGSIDSGVDENTTDVFLEVALFNSSSIARAGRIYGIDSDARYRFERGVDPAFVEDGAKLAIAMIQKLCGGTANELVKAGKTPEWKRAISFNPERIKSLGGVEVPQDKIQKILTSLGFEQKGDTVIPPSWRADIEGEADIVEEILRIHGYDHLPVTPLPKLASVRLPAADRILQSKRLLASAGYLEVCSYSFISQPQAKRFVGGMENLALANPISEELSDMRPNLLPNLLAAAAKNQSRGFKNLRLAEVGLTYQDTTPTGQQMVAAGIISQEAINEIAFVNKVKVLDYTSDNYIAYKMKKGALKPLLKVEVQHSLTLKVKADVLSLLASLGVGKYEITREAPDWYHPGRSAAVKQGKNVLAYFGELHPALLKEFDVDGIGAFEVFLDKIPTPRTKTKSKPALKISDYQTVARDFAFLVDENILSSDITKAILSAEKDLIKDIKIFDSYDGIGIDEGKKSIALQVTLQANDRTLSDAEITGVASKIIEAAKALGGTLRS